MRTPWGPKNKRSRSECGHETTSSAEGESGVGSREESKMAQDSLCRLQSRVSGHLCGGPNANPGGRPGHTQAGDLSRISGDVGKRACSIVEPRFHTSRPGFGKEVPMIPTTDLVFDGGGGGGGGGGR